MDVLLTAAVVDDPEKLVPKLLQKKKKKKDTSSGATFQRQVHAQKLSKHSDEQNFTCSLLCLSRCELLFGHYYQSVLKNTLSTTRNQRRKDQQPLHIFTNLH